jgi:hypothetical protein
MRPRRTTQWPSAAVVIWLVALLMLLPSVAQAGDPEKDGEEGGSEEAAEPEKKADTPRVITNDDLKKYGSGSNAGVPVPPTRPVPLPRPKRPEEPVIEVQPEDRLEDAPRPELEARQLELESLLAYLEAKLGWMKNPFLRRPTPPEGEVILDPALSGKQEWDRTYERAQDTRERLERLRRWFMDNPPKY